MILPRTRENYWPSRNLLLVPDRGQAPALPGYPGVFRENQSYSCWHVCKKFLLIYLIPADRPSFPLIHAFMLPIPSLDIKDISSLSQQNKRSLHFMSTTLLVNCLTEASVECVSTGRELWLRSQKAQVLLPQPCPQLAWWTWTSYSRLDFSLLALSLKHRVVLNVLWYCGFKN